MNAFAQQVLGMALLAGASAVHAQAWESVYTPLHGQQQCRQVSHDEPGSRETVFQCKGPNGFPYQWSSGDDRLFLSFGLQADKEKAASQTLLPHNYSADDAKIEWLFKPGTTAGGIPAAAVLRFMLAADDERQKPGQVLVAYQIQPGRTCQMAYVDARANRDANTLIRQAVYANAGAFDCSQAPRIVGAWKAYPVEALAQSKPSQDMDLHFLANGQGEYLDGAGCYYTAKDHRILFDDPSTWRYFFISDIYDTRRAWVNIDGSVHVLDLRGEPSVQEIQAGQRRQWEYKAGDVRAILDMTVAQAQQGSWTEQGVLTVQRAGAQLSLEVSGDCGS